VAHTIVLVDDHPVFRRGLDSLLAIEEELRVVGEASDGLAAVELVCQVKPDLVIMDINMPHLDGIEATQKILAESPETKVVALSVHSGRQFVRGMIEAGALGYILKESIPEEMISGIRTVLKGDVYLSESISTVLFQDYKNLIGKVQSNSYDQVSPLLHTKLHRPPISMDIIPRLRLVELLEKGVLNPLTLVSAPAGYGKSILVSQWLDVTKAHGVWISLDESDNDLRVFLSYALEAIRTAFPGCDLLTGSLLATINLPSKKVTAHHLLNDLETLPDRMILVFDDYQSIHNTEIHEFMMELLVHPSPNMHIVVVTRRDPPLSLTGLRSRGMVTEISAKDLRFTLAETKSFLERFLHIAIEQKTAEVLDEKMEGWVTGLHLAALSIRNDADQERLVAGLQETSHYVRDYLIQEVLVHLPPQNKRYLLQTAILDRFCAPLCNALSQVTLEQNQIEGETSGGEFIHWLQKTNLFVISLDTANEWFRFHHLFQKHLQNELRKVFSAAEIAALQEQASAWFENRRLIDEALKHALAAGNTVRSAQIIESNWRAMMNRGKWYVVAGWLSKLTDDVVQQNPLLLLAQAWKHYYYLDVAAITPLMDQIEQLTNGQKGLPDLSAEIAMFRSYAAYFENRGAESLKEIDYALKNIPEADVEFRSQSEILYGLAGHMEGQLEQVTRRVHTWLENPLPIDPLRKSCLMWTLLFTHYMAGNLQMVSQHIPQFKKTARANGIDNFTAWGDYLDGLVKLQQGDIENAICQLEQAGKRKYQHFTRAAADAVGALAIAYQANGQSEIAGKTLESLEEFCAYLGAPFVALAEACAAQVALMAGRMGFALDWLRKTSPIPAAVMMSWYVQPNVNRCRVLVAEGSRSELEEAERTLRGLSQMNESHHNICQLIGILNLEAIACERLGKTEEALTVLEQAVKLADPGGFVFPFLECGSPMADLLHLLIGKKVMGSSLKKLLTAFKKETEPAAPDMSAPPESPSSAIDQPLVEPLTNRELDVLELLVQRLQNKEIAEKLFVSNQTVKTHLKNIYQKLNVPNRRKAVAYAYRLGIIKRR
jgi:LuxR family maltose regulon positive regulatory protein